MAGLLDWVTEKAKQQYQQGLLNQVINDPASIGRELGQLFNPAYMSQVKPMTQQQALDVALSAPMMGGIISTDIAKKLNMPVTLPQSDDFISAVKGTPNAQITPEGLKLNLVRFQKPEQELMESVRTGVFYLPEGSANVKHYKNKGTMASGNPYGGEQKISGETLYKNPLFVKGATGGKAPEEAYKTLFGKDALTELDKYVRHTAGAPRHLKEEAVYDFLQKYAPESADNAWNIVENSKQGNQLRYALQEAVIANQARKKGYDSIIGYSKGRGDKGNFISEVFDIRESHYPSPSGEFYMMPEFESLLK